MRHAITKRANHTLSKHIFDDTMSDSMDDTMSFVLHLTTPRHHYVQKSARSEGIIGIIVSSLKHEAFHDETTPL
jgi:hypothetical protein